MKIKSPLFGFFSLIVIILVITATSPPEATLGKSARIVYLHGAWVWASLFAFVAAGLMGLIGLLKLIAGKANQVNNQWSRAWGRTGLFFWITYLPISMWAMQANWNGLFLAEPRWRIALIFAIGGSLLQLGLTFLPVIWASFWNLVYVITLFAVLQTAENVMHPPSPILDSEAWRIQIFFGGLTLLVIASAWQFSRWFKSIES
jgi:hypothetical protein